MKVVMKPVIGSAKANLECAKDEMIRVIAFRGWLALRRTVKKSR